MTTIPLADLLARVPDGVGIDMPGADGGWAVAVIGGRVYRARVAPVERGGVVSAETLRRAAEAIRNDWRDEEEGREFMFAVADLLDGAAGHVEYTGRLHDDDVVDALAVANAYLEETP